jgi:hypothetical protein
MKMVTEGLSTSSLRGQPSGLRLPTVQTIDEFPRADGEPRLQEHPGIEECAPDGFRVDF